MDRYLVFSPETFIFYDKQGVCFYHSLSHNSFETKHTPFIDNILLPLSEDPRLLYQTRISSIQYQQNQFLIDKLISAGFAKIFSSGHLYSPSYPPVIKLNENLVSIIKKVENGDKGCLLKYVHQLNLFLSGDKNKSPFSHQVPFPFSPSNIEIQGADLLRFVANLRYCPINRINIFPSKESDLIPKKNYIEDLFLENPNIFIYLAPGSWTTDSIMAVSATYPFCHVIITTFPARYDKRLQAFPHLFLVDSTVALDKAERIPIRDKQIVPIINQNDGFFENYVFTQREEILNCGKRDIFLHQSLNSNCFGHLFVLPDRTVCGNLNGDTIGDIYDSPVDLVYRELTNVHSVWLKTRPSFSCPDCRFNRLCPCISNYELWKGDYHMCFNR
jgi:pseudo-rSAM protein